MSIKYSLHETEILADLRELLEIAVDPHIEVAEDAEVPEESPILIILYKDRPYMIAVECLEKDAPNA